MTTQLLPKDKSLSKWVGRFPAVDRTCRNVLFKKFKELKHGHLTIIDKTDNSPVIFEFGDLAADIDVKLTVNKTCFYSRTLFGGSIGNGESFIDEDWDTNNLTGLVQLFVKNRELLQGIDNGIGSLLQPVQKYFHGLRSNTIDGSRENIRSHYDIGNEFFKLFLDETMMYSSGVYESTLTDLKTASLKKIELICKKLDLQPTDHLVEIGTGWGSLAIFAAKHYGCRVTTTTISKEQFDYAVQKVNEAGLSDRVTVLFADYRKISGLYDKLVSVEMIEAVGLDHLEVYFEKCSSLLKPEGLMVLQAITIRDQYYENARTSVDFIQRHVFPGCGIPSVHAMMNALTKKSDMILVEQKDFAEDYAQTLHHWAQNLNQNKHQITKLGYPPFLYRLWQYYFAYCEGGFRERSIGLSQMVLTKPNYRNRSLV